MLRRESIVLAAALTLVSGVAVMAQQPTAKQLSQTARASTDIQSRVKAYEEACISNLRTLNTAEGTYWGGDPQKGYARSLEQLGPKGVNFIEPILASGKKAGYRFILTPGPANANAVVMNSTITARPLKVLAEGQRSFFTDETGVIRSTPEKRGARASDPAIQ
jgi:hypothetical protein